MNASNLLAGVIEQLSICLYWFDGSVFHSNWWTKIRL